MNPSPGGSSGAPRVSVLRSVDELGPIEPAWRELAERSGNAFLTPEWFNAWLRHYGARAEPAVVAAIAPDGRLLGVLPFVRSSSSARTLRFCGANLGDDFHPAAAPADEAALADALAGALGQRPLRRSTLVLDHVAVEASWWHRIPSSAEGALATSFSRGDVLPFIELGGDGWEGYLTGRSSNLRSQIRRKTRALERRFDVAFRATAEPAELSADLDTFLRLHDERWRGRGGSSIASPTARDFHRDFAAASLARGWLRLIFLELDGEPVAAWYGWRVGGTYSYYLAGFSPEWAHQSVGFVLLAGTIRIAIEEGAERYELLRGDEVYKSRFATGERRVQTVVLTPAMSSARVIAAIEAAAWRRGRRLPPSLRRHARAIYDRLDDVVHTSRSR